VFQRYGEHSSGISGLNQWKRKNLTGCSGYVTVSGVNLSIRRGEWVVLYGASGGGKTTLLNIIGTIDKPTKGQLTISGISEHLTATRGRTREHRDVLNGSSFICYSY
jgi:ABC-type lipoprotein export system ATPase subunit